MAVKKSGAVLESEAKIIFGTTGPSIPSWETPVTVSVVREFIPEDAEWQQIVILNGNTRFTIEQWVKIESFIKEATLLLENV